MSLRDSFSDRVGRLSGVILVLCLGSSMAVAQRVRITDADVSLIQISTEASGQANSSAAGSNEVVRRRPILMLNSHDSTHDQRLLEEAIYKESSRHNLDPNLVFAIVWQESRFNLSAVSPKNARGPMQLMPATAARFGVRNAHDPKESVRGGVEYLVWLLDRFGGNVSLALAGFNAGEGAVEAYLYGRTLILSDGKVINRRGIRTDGIPPYAETVNYVRRIAERYRMLRMAGELVE